jgi:minor histocompatibility antigen H13
VMQPLVAAVEGEFSLLGLGDIVIPGIFVAILLRFDAVQAGVKGLQSAAQPYPKPFFYANIISYALGLYVTLYVMNTFKAAQPALLYLVPACLGASVVSAAYTGSFKALLAYDEEDTAKEDKKEK